MSVTVNGTNGLTFNDGSSQQTAATGFGFKNRIINGAMMIDQRNAGANVSTGSNIVAYLTDRWRVVYSQPSKMTAQQNAGSVTPPNGFVNYQGITSSSAYTVGSAEVFMLQQLIEGYNVADLGWGTANAQPVTISFWVRSSLTGTFGASLQNDGGSRSYPFTYVINAANAWEYKTITVAGDTTGTWLKTNGLGVQLTFGLGVGSTLSGTAGAWAAGNYVSATGATSVVGTNGATFYITGVQLEKGSTATSFDYRPYGTELALCWRYYQRHYDFKGTGALSSGGTNAFRCGSLLPVQMRASPTVGLIGTIGFFDGSNAATATSFSTTYSTISSIEFDAALSATLKSNGVAATYTGGGFSVTASAEL